MFIIFLQNNENDCGWACISNVLLQYDSEISPTYLRKNSTILTDELNAFEICQILKEYFIKCEGFRVGKLFFEKNDITNPIIVQIKRNDSFHFVVVAKKINNKLLILDPAVGAYKSSTRDFDKVFTSIILVTNKLDCYKPKKIKSNINLKKIFSFISKKSLIYILIESVIVSLTEFAITYYLKILIDYIIPKKNIEFLVLSFAIIFLISLVSSFCLFFRAKMTFLISQKYSEKIFSRLSKNIFNEKLVFFGRKRIGDFTSRISDIFEISGDVLFLILNVTINVIMLAILISIMAFSSPLFVLIIFLCAISYVYVSLHYNRVYSSAYNLFREQYAFFENSYIRSINSIFSIKSFSNDTQSFKDVNKEFKNSNKKNLSAFNIQNYQKSILYLIQNTFQIIMLVYGAWCVIENTFSLGTFVFIISIVQYLNSSFDLITQIQPTYQRLKVSWERIYYFTKSSEENGLLESHSSHNHNNSFVPHKIIFSNASLSIDQKEIFSNFNILFDFDNNKIIGLSGKSGVGKSMLMASMVKLYDLTSGTIKINNINIQKIKGKDIRKRILLLNQKPQFFPGYSIFTTSPKAISMILSLFELMGLKEELNIDDAENLKRVINFPDNLSGGQQQRLYICLALALKPSMIILDETLSGINDEWINNLFVYLKNKKMAAIVISHDYNILKKTGKIIYI